MTGCPGMKFPRWLSLVLGLAVAGCDSAASGPPERGEVRFAVTEARQDGVVKVLQTRLPSLVLAEKETPGYAAKLASLESGAADVTFVPSNVLYAAFVKGTDANPWPHTRLRGVAVLHTSALNLIVAPGVDFRSLKDLRGKRAGMPLAAEATEFTVRLLFSLIGFSPADLHLQRVPSEDIPRQLADGSLDAVFDLFRRRSGSVEAMLAVPGARLVSIIGEDVTTLKQQYPFLRQVVVPAGAYGRNEEVQTVGIDMIFVCRIDLDEDIVHRMLEAFFSGSTAELANVLPDSHTVSVNRALATPIPLHAGAARFYREQELFR